MSTTHDHDDQFLTALRAFAEGDESQADDAATLDAAFRRLDAGEGAQPTVWPRWVAGVGAVAAAAALVFVTTSAEDSQPEVATAAPAAPTQAVIEDAPAEAATADDTRVVVRSGGLRLADDRRVLGLRAEVPLGQPLVAETTDACVGLASGEVCFARETRFSLARPSPTLSVVQLDRGHATVSSPPDAGTVRVDTAHGTVEVADARASVDVPGDAPVVVIAVLAGEVSYRNAEGVVNTLAHGQTVELRATPVDIDAPVGAAVASPAQMLERAQQQRKDGKLGKAASTFAQLIKLHPATEEGRRAMVSLGDLELTRRKRPAVALRWLDRYLQSSGQGVLAQEASYLRIEALHALGRGDQERQSIEQFLDRYPGAPYASLLRNRLKAMK